MKGVVGELRGKTYVPSAYESRDRGGSAGGYGLPHGTAGSGGGGTGGMGPMVSIGYGGTPIGFEGGVRGGAVSAPETMPGQYPYPPKTGYDETSASRPGGRKVGGGSVHEVPGVEGIPPSGDHGYGCPHGCGFTGRSPHGMARHVYKKHNGFKGLGHAMVNGKKGVPSTLGVHGTGYNSGVEYRGETEGPKEWEANEHEWDHAAKLARPTDNISSYVTGDRGGSFVRMKGVTG